MTHARTHERIGAALVLAALILAGATLARGDEYHRVRVPMQDVEAYDDLTYWTTPIASGYCTSDGYISIAPAILRHTEYLGELDLSTRGVDVYAIHPLDRDDDRIPFGEGELCWVLVWHKLGTMTFVFKPVEVEHE